MDPELKQYLTEMEARIDKRFERIDARFEELETRIDQRIDARFEELETRIDQRFDGMRQHVAGVVDAAEDRMKDFTREAVRDMETHIVTKFMDIANGHEERMRSHESVNKTITDSVLARMSLLESRMLRLERERPSH